MWYKQSIISVAMATIMLVSLCAVCASTSVSAATSSSKATVQATPDLVGSPIAAGTGPALLVSQGSTSTYVDVFVKGYDGALWWRPWDATKSTWTKSWTSLGNPPSGALTSSPAAVSRQPGYINVYVRGTDGAVWQKALAGFYWYDWTSIGGQVAPNTGPSACGWTGMEQVFIQGTNGLLYTNQWNSATSWVGWVSLGGHLTSSPCAVSRSKGYMNAYVRGTDGAVWQKAYDPSTKTWAWNYLGGQIAPGTGPAASGWGANREDVFVEGTNGALYQKTWTLSSSWSGWTSLGGQLSASPTAAEFTSAGVMAGEVWVRGTNGLLYFRGFDVSSSWGWYGPLQGPP